MKNVVNYDSVHQSQNCVDILDAIPLTVIVKVSNFMLEYIYEIITIYY